MTNAMQEREHYSTGETCIIHESCDGTEDDCRTEMGNRPIMATQHTPGPMPALSVHTSKGGGLEIRAGDATLFDARSNGYTNKYGIAFADRIVACVNAHDGLVAERDALRAEVAALRSAIEPIANGVVMRGVFSHAHTVERYQRICRAALAGGGK